jgi:hypothetical protein
MFIIKFTQRPFREAVEFLTCDSFKVEYEEKRFDQPHVVGRNKEGEEIFWMPVIDKAYVLNESGKTIDTVNFNMPPNVENISSCEEHLAPFTFYD